MDRETGPRTRPTGPAAPGEGFAVPEQGRPPEDSDTEQDITEPDTTEQDTTEPDTSASASATATAPGATAPGTMAPSTAGPNAPVPARAIMETFSADPRAAAWVRRAIMALVVAIGVTVWQGWRWGLTAAVLVVVVDTLYQSKAMSPIPADVLASGAQRRTRRRLALLRPAGYLTLNGRAIPGSDQVIDHLVVGPAGVYAVDSERWDRRLPVRTTAAGPASSGVLYHGPYSQSARLAHARWEAAQAARLIGAELHQDLRVRPTMVIYGPTIPWSVATLRGVEVFSGKRVRKFFRKESRLSRKQRLDTHEIEAIYQAAARVLPPVQ